MIEVKDVSFRYPGANDWVLQHVDLQIERNEFIAIIGSNGSGKSTLCKTFNQLIPNYYVGDFEGEVLIDGESVAQSSVGELSKKVAYVYQDFENQLVRPTVFEEACFSPLNFGYEDYKERAMLALEILNLTHLKDEYIWQLSGGQKHLTALAGALSLNPDILIIDEPVAQLDPAHAIELYDKLKMLHEEFGKTIIVIEHHTEFIANYCKSVLLMNEGKVEWKKPVDEALSLIEELESKNIHPPQVTQLFSLLNIKDGEYYPIRVKEAVELFDEHFIVDPPHEQLKEQVNSLKEFIRLEEVSYGYKTLTRERKMIFQHLNLSINEDENTAIVGSNGAGKSTLLKMIAGMLKIRNGKIFINGKQTNKLSPEKLADIAAYIFQDPEEMFIDDSVYKEIDYFLKVRKVEDRQQFVENILHSFRLDDLKERDARLLSGGQQRRTSLAIGIAMKPSVVLLDEPTASLDISSRKEMMNMLLELKEFVRTTIVATHDMELVADWADRVLVLEHGQLLFDGTPADLFSNQSLLKRGSLIPPQIVEFSHAANIHPVSLSVQKLLQRVKIREENSVECLSIAVR